MTTLRITDYAGTSFTITTNESSDDFNARIDEAFNTRNYNIRLVDFTRVDVRNIAMITEVKTDTPTHPEPPAEEPTEPEQPIENEPAEEPSELEQPAEDEPTSDDPAEEETEEPIEPEPSDNN